MQFAEMDMQFAETGMQSSERDMLFFLWLSETDMQFILHAAG